MALTFTQFLEVAAEQGEVVNIQFEERLFGLVSILGRITNALATENIPYEVIGGLAVLIHVEAANPEHSTLTRDVDLMVKRSDLERIQRTAAAHGFRYRHAASVDMLIFGEMDSAKNAVHLIFSEEKVRPHYASAAPAIEPEEKQLMNQPVMVIPVFGLLTMKLTSNRDKDRVHIRSMDAAGLITDQIADRLEPELMARLEQIRATE